MSNLIFDSYKETRLEEIEEELHQENPLDPHIRKKAYEILLRELYHYPPRSFGASVTSYRYEIHARVPNLYVSILLLLGTWGAHQRDAMTDYSTINWEYTRP